MSSAMRFLVFVYGTLKIGEPNHFVLDPKIHNNVQSGVSQFIGKAETSMKYPLVIATKYNIPFLLDKADFGHFVKGEVYEVDQTVMEKLDKLEDYPDFYDREVQDLVSLEDRSIIQARVYLIRNFPDRLLETEMLEEYKDDPNRPYNASEAGNSSLNDL